MIRAFIGIRYRQLIRSLVGIGPVRLIFLAGLLIFALAFIFLQTVMPSNSYYVTGMALGIILFIQIKRQDRDFLKIYFEDYKRICFVEYVTLVAPVIIFLAVHIQVIPLLLLVTGLGMIIQLDLKHGQRSLNTKLQRLIPAECIEWKGGVRQSLIIMSVLWIAGLVTSFVVWSVPVVLFILGIIPFSFYEKGESWQMIIAFEMKPSKFLLRKIGMVTVLYTFIAMPLIIAYMAFNGKEWYIPAAEYFVFISLYIYLVLNKYAFYVPKIKPPASQMFGAIGVLCVIIPVFLPVIWLLSVRFYFKSIKNLNIYLNDYN